MTISLADSLARPLVSDGGWSTQIHALGVPSDELAELANITQPDLVAGLTRAYLEAGAEVLTTNTFSANRFALQRHAPERTVDEVNRSGALLARRAARDANVLIVGSIGPSGKILAVKETPEAELVDLFAEQATALAAGGVDALVLETFSELAEILLALRTVKEATGLPVIASMSFDAGPQRARTMMGAPAGECAATLEEAGADAIGSNCGGGVSTALPAVVALRAATELPLWVKPNAGMPELHEGRPMWRQTPEEFAQPIPQLLDAGANIIGGCCGSGPEHIARIAKIVAKRRS